jgi:hypothetical protein
VRDGRLLSVNTLSALGLALAVKLVELGEIATSRGSSLSTQVEP